MNASLETKALLTYLISALGYQSADTDNDLALDGVDWQRLISLANTHKVLPLLHLGLRRTRTSAPQSSAAYLEHFFHRNATRNLALYRKLLEVLTLLDQAHIYAIPYKGPLFALHTYGHIAHRQFGDLDLLMDERDYARARNHLLQHGFRLAAEYDWECTLMHTQQGYALDIHKALTPSNFPIRLNLRQLKNRLVEQSAQAGPIRTLNAEDMLLILCIQLAKDAWAHAFKPVQLAKLCDIAALTRNHPDLDWARVYKRARAIGCIRIVAVALSVSRRLLGALTEDVPEFQSGDAKNALVDDVVRKLTREPKAVGEGDLAPRRFHFLIRERWRDKLAPRYHDLAQRIPPNERDHAFLPLPPQLAIFYWVIRPVRLLRDSSRQAMRFLRERTLTGRKPPHP